MNLDQYRQELQEMRTRLECFFKEMAGDDLPALLSSKAVAETYLIHAHKSRRLAAVWALTFHWPHDHKTAELFEKAALGDPGVEVRAMATSNLGTIYSRTNDVRMGRFLATLALDENEKLEVREGAYRALFILVGTPSYDQPPLVGFELLRDANWGFVNSFLRWG